MSHIGYGLQGSYISLSLGVVITFISRMFQHIKYLVGIIKKYYSRSPKHYIGHKKAAQSGQNLHTTPSLGKI